MKRQIIKLSLIIFLTSNFLQAGAIDKAWDSSVSDTLREGCTILINKKEAKLSKTFITIISGMAAKAYMKESNNNAEDMKDSNTFKDIVSKVVVKGCKGAFFIEKNEKFKKITKLQNFNFTQKVRGMMEVYIKEVLNKNE